MEEARGRTHVAISFNLQINNPVFAFQKFDRPVFATAKTAPSWQTVVAVAGTGLLGFLQVKYSGNQRSPFEAYPKTSFLALSSFLLYCFSYNVKVMYLPGHRMSVVSRFCMILFGPLFLSSVSCLLFPDSLQPVLITASLTFSLSRLLPEFAIRSLWIWYANVVSLLLNKLHDWGRFRGRSKIRNRGQGNLVIRNGRGEICV